MNGIALHMDSQLRPGRNSEPVRGGKKGYGPYHRARKRGGTLGEAPLKGEGENRARINVECL